MNIKEFSWKINQELQSLGYDKIKHGHVLLVVSKALGYKDWNVASADIIDLEMMEDEILLNKIDDDNFGNIWNGKGDRFL